MFKVDFAKELAARTGQTQKQAETMIDEFFDLLVESCLKEGFVQFIGHGTFESRMTNAREATNPKTGEKIMVPSKTSIRFKPGKKLKNF